MVYPHSPCGTKRADPPLNADIFSIISNSGQRAFVAIVTSLTLQETYGLLIKSRPLSCQLFLA